MADGFTLYGSPHSQFTYKVALTLHLAGTRFSFRYVSFQKGMHRTPEFRALSRWGQVPVLTHGGRILVQSGAILEYLAATLSKFDAPDPESRQRLREWLYWNADRLAPPIYGCYGVKLGQLKLLPIAVDPVIAAYHRQSAAAALAALDTYLGDHDFLAAGEPTIADLGCYGEIAFAELADIDLGQWPNLAAWSGRIVALPRFKAPFALLAMADAEIAP
jgi:glutathione S-transferase